MLGLKLNHVSKRGHWSMQLHKKVVTKITRIEYSLRDSSRDLHSRIHARSGILLSDLNDQTYTIPHLNHSRTDAVILTSTSPQTWAVYSGLIKQFREWKQQQKTSTCVGRLICPEGRVSSLNKCNPIYSTAWLRSRSDFDQLYLNMYFIELQGYGLPIYINTCISHMAYSLSI